MIHRYHSQSSYATTLICFHERKVLSTMMDNSNEPDREQDENERPQFPHPPWMVGVTLILAVSVIAAGLADPIWFLIGSPCILVLVIYIYVKIEKRMRRTG
jgi:hypothetical protein